MQDLTPVGLSEDGTTLVLVSPRARSSPFPSTPGCAQHCAARTLDSASWR